MDARRGTRTAFLAEAGWARASLAAMAGDASQRRYFRLTLGTQTAVLMDAPPEPGNSTAAFVRIAGHLGQLGLSAPRLLAADIPQGFLLLEDFGDALYSALLAADPTAENRLYSGAIDVLIALHPHPPLPGLVALDTHQMVQIARLALDWYVPAATGAPGGQAVMDALAEAAERLVLGPQVLMLRDYHAGNLIWLPDRVGPAQDDPARTGLLDFQDAMAAHPAYDLVSVLQDARRDVSAATEAAMIARYCAATGQNSPDFAAAYALLGCQRALRILGIFARLCLHSGKSGYLHHAPRVWHQLQRNLAHPALSQLAILCDRLIPEPTAQRLSRIKDQCGTHPLP